ncbi:MAG: multiheme c-type cytochrome [bacterium]|nr:beta-ketoacyl-ACP synthase [bacterium]
MKKQRNILFVFMVICFVMLAVSAQAQKAGKKLNPNLNQSVGDLSSVKAIVIDRGLTADGKKCIDCHQKNHPGVINDWKNSRHGHVGVSCIDCHGVKKEDPTASQCEGLKGTDIFESVLVPPSRCAQCHVKEAEQFNKSGHFRAYHQIIPKDNLHALVQVHEGQNHPTLKNASNETGCMQCHGTKIELGKDGKPTAETWPNAGMGNIYPDGSTGNCSACHTRHKFDVAEARKPHACASCHLGPDHPDIEIFENSKHGHVYNTDGDNWTWTSSPDAWEPGDYRGPTCATCHMSGIGKLKTTHDITERLYWNLWAQKSQVRNSEDVMSPVLGNGIEGRQKMEQVCSSCHSELHTKGFFKQGDKAVQLYNVAYYDPAKKMYDELASKNLLKKNPWTDEFQKVFYYLWHHEGRRARQGAMMGGPDYAHWHGFFELQQDLYKLQEIYAKRLKAGKIEE